MSQQQYSTPRTSGGQTSDQTTGQQSGQTGSQQGGKFGGQQGGQWTGQMSGYGGQYGSGGQGGTVGQGQRGGVQQGGQTTGQQGGQITSQQGGIQVQQRMPDSGRRFEDTLTDELRLAIHDFSQAATVAEWCSTRCVQEGAHMAECARLCRDVADIAELNVDLIARDSVFGPDLAQNFITAAEETIQECEQHSAVHCQECAASLRRAVKSTRKMLQSFGRQPVAAGPGMSTG